MPFSQKNRNIKKYSDYNTAGLIIVSSSNEYLLVKGRKNEWSFPKGKRESYDTDSLATALREAVEETSLKISTNSKKLRYTKIILKCIFYVCVFKKKCRISRAPTSEIKDVRWFTEEEVYSLNLNYITKVFFDRKKKKRRGRIPSVPSEVSISSEASGNSITSATTSATTSAMIDSLRSVNNTPPPYF